MADNSLTKYRLDSLTPPSPLGSTIPTTVTGPQPKFQNAPADQSAQVANYLNSPDMVLAQKPATPNPVLSWIGNLFDTTDQADNPVEWAWDGFLKTMQWGYDRANQAAVYGLAALPGGTQTLSWDQANNVSLGQQVVGNLIYDYNSLTGNQGAFDITKAADRKNMFEDNLVGKLASGAVDIGAMMFADPYMVLGKAAKIGRLKYLDSPYTGERLAAAVPVVEEQLAKVGTVPTKDMHPLAQLSIFAAGTNEAGKPLRTMQEIMAHPVLRNASNPEQVASALMSADSPQHAFDALRYMMGDISVLPKLRGEQADILDFISKAQTEELALKLRYRPKSQAKILADYDARMSKAHYELQQTSKAHKRGEATAQELTNAHRVMDRAIEDYRMVRDLRLPDPIEQMSGRAAGRRLPHVQAAIDQMTQKDKFFQKMLGDEESRVNNVTNNLWNALDQDNSAVSWMQLLPGKKVVTNGAKGMPVDNAFGRMVEASREKRAIATGQQAQTKGQWVANYFGASPTSRVMSLWRWTGNENPSGYIATDGAASQGAWRELAAQLNDVEAFSGKSNIITKQVQQKVKVGKNLVDKTADVQFEVGGVGVKDEILRKFIGTWTDGNAMDQVSRHQVLEETEAQILRNIGDYHGLDPQEVETLLQKLQIERANRIAEITNGRGYWIEDGKIHKAPFLESQLQNGTYMLNFRAIEKEMIRYKKEGLSRKIADGSSLVADHMSNLYDEFQALWRPSVLLRLGYTQRNVTEGIIRATAFMFSLDPKNLAAPLMDSLVQAGYGTRNMIAPKWIEHNAAKVTDGLDTRSFVKWLNKQQTAGVDAINRAEASIAIVAAKRADALASGNMEAVRVFDRHLAQFRQLRQSAFDSHAALENRQIALALYRGQGKMKMRRYSGETTISGHVMDQAFANDNYSQVAAANASSNQTRQFESHITMNAAERLLRDTVLKTNMRVDPSDTKHYFAAVSDAIQQFKSDDVGRMIINGDSPAKIASYLLNNPAGRSRAEFLGLMPPVGEKGFPVTSWDEGVAYATQMIERYNSLTVVPELRAVIKQARPSEGVVRQFLNGRDDLIPMVGDITQELGHSNLLNVTRKLTRTMFKWLGTIPEDALVRVPFYGRRHQIALESLVSDLHRQVGDMVTVRDLQKVQEIAHARALTDTRRWLYTIERRTNLGKIGEHVFPFISATQNSVTTFGRLIWNDPRIAVALAGMWNAPQKMHIEDENGNIVLGFPLDLIPQGIKEKFGLDNMLNMKISKNGLNVLFQMNGENPIPSPGPLVTLPASEIMKHGWFGQSIDAPGLLKQALGEQQANTLWDGWKTYLFGAGQGVSENPGSYDMIFPPWLQKMIQMQEGELNSVQYATQYALQMRTEQAKYLAGYREAPPTADEIKTRTNNLYWVKILGNLTAFTPPQYTSKLQPLIDVVKANKQNYGLAGDRLNSELFGDYLTMLGDFSITKNVAGAQSNVVAYANARKYESLIGRIAPEVGSDMNTLGIILNNGNMTNALYDPSVHAWQQATNIPGVAEKYRAMQSPQESMVASQRNAGWVSYIKGMDVLDSVLRQRGLKSYRAAGAADLALAKEQLIQRLAQDPAYAGWYSDYISFGSTKTVNAVKVLTAALNDRQFAKDNAGTGLWQAAQQYLMARDQMVSGQITQDEWDAIRSDLSAYNTEWAAVANRYLTSDDKPVDVGVSFGMMGG